MSAAYAPAVPSATTSIAAKARALMWSFSHLKRRRLTRDVEEPADEALAVAHSGDVAAQPGIEAETAAGALERKQEHQQGQEHVGPRPLGRIAVKAEPKLQCIGDGQRAHQSHRKPEDHRSSEYQLGEKYDGPKDRHARQHGILQKCAVKLKSG